MRASIREDVVQACVFLHGQGLQRRHGDHRQVQRHGHALGQRNGKAHTGERARPAADGDTLERLPGHASLRQQAVGHRQHQFAVPARRQFAACEDFLAMDQRDRTGFG